MRNVYSDFCERKNLGDNVSLDQLELMIESEARREEADDRSLAEYDLIGPDTKK